VKKSRLVIILLFIIGSPGLACAVEPMQASIQDVKNRHVKQLMSLPGIVSVGIGLDDNKNPIIIISLEKDDSELITKLPRQLEGYSVHIQVSGKVHSLN